MPTLTKADVASLPQGKGPLGVKVIAFFKLITAGLLVALALGIFREIGGNPAAETEHLVATLKLDPANKYIHTAMETISGVSRRQLYFYSAGTFVYAMLYTIEGVGLILRKRWAEYFTVFMTGSLIPFEAYEVLRQPNVMKVLVLAVNVAIVAYLVVQLRRSHGAEPMPAQTPEATATSIVD